MQCRWEIGWTRVPLLMEVLQAFVVLVRITVSLLKRIKGILLTLKRKSMVRGS